MSFQDNGQFTGSFQGSSSFIPMVGVLANRYRNSDKLIAARYDIAAGAGQAVAGDPVTVVNQAGGSSTGAIDGLNAQCAAITAKAGSATPDGFLLQSPNDIVPVAGGEAFPVAGFFSLVALLGSKCEVWLPCYTDQSDVSMNQQNETAVTAATLFTEALTWDYSNHYLRKLNLSASPAESVLPIRVLSAPVAAKKLSYNNGTGKASWVDCTAIKVEL